KKYKKILEILSNQLIEHAGTLLEIIFIFMYLLHKWAKPIHYGISREQEQLEIKYNPSIEVSEEADREKIESIYANKFHEIQEKEIDRGTTLIGPHRDDLVFYVNQKDVQTYGSQGQQRTTALSVKLA